MSEEGGIAQRSSADPVLRPTAVSLEALVFHGFALSKRLLPLPVDLCIKLNDVAPSLQSDYRIFLTTTRDSAPASRIGTQALAGRPLELLPLHRKAGSHVPPNSLS